jgi:hypothetical protein
MQHVQAGNKLYSALTTRSRVFVTTTYHPVLVSNDQRDKSTTAAARLTLAAGARLMCLALHVLTGSSTEAPTIKQIISGATGSNFDTSMWQLPEISAQVDEIHKHETETFRVIMKKNGVRMTITPAKLRSMKEANDVRLERQRQASSSGQGGKKIASRYKCPFWMAQCNGKSQPCARCKPLLGWVPKPK